MKKKFDFIIIGGGISGLSMGALLCKKGYDVLLCEKSKKTGGRYKSVQREGFNIEFGFKGNRFAEQGCVKKLFNLMGEEIEFIHSNEILRFENGSFSVLPRGLIPVFMDNNLNLGDKIVFLNLYRKIMCSSPDDYYNTTLWDWLSSQTQRKNILNLFSYYTQLGLVSQNIEETSMGEFIFLAKKGLKTRYSFGIPKEGWHKKLLLFTSIISEKGRLLTSVKANKIKIVEKKCTGVETDAGTFFAKYIITAFPLQSGLFKLVPKEHFPYEFVEDVINLKPTCGINLDFCLNKIISKENRLIATRDPYPNTQGILVSNLSPNSAPSGKTYGSWLSLLTLEGMKDKAILEKEKRRMEKLMDMMFPGLWKHCLFKRFLILKRINAAKPIVGQTNNKRSDFLAPGIKNLFFIGDSTKGVGGGGDVAINSVLMAYEKIIGIVKENFT